MTRQARDVRRRGVQAVLTERDQVVLSALARFGIARTSQLVGLAFTGVRPDTAHRRLRVLFDAGYLETQVFDRSTENLYRLGPVGRRWAHDRDLEVFKQPRLALEHHLAVVGAWVDLARACHEIPGCELVRVVPEWELRKLPESAGYPLVPDALVEISVLEYQSVRMALEVDLRSEGLSVLSRKLQHYSRLWGMEIGLWGWTDFGLAFAVSRWPETRRQKLASMLDESWPGWWMLWDEKDGLGQELARLFEMSIAPLKDSPYGKGRIFRLSDGLSVHES